MNQNMNSLVLSFAPLCPSLCPIVKLLKKHYCFILCLFLFDSTLHDSKIDLQNKLMNDL